MSQGTALFGKGHSVTLPSSGDAPVITFTTDDPYLPQRSHDVCEGVNVMRDLTPETMAVLEAEKAESKRVKTPVPQSK
jgi:hypothetical protein